ncbi:MAG TPA: PAS domain-containing sensor histidine kinase [Thermoanaerobaculia bacterium]
MILDPLLDTAPCGFLRLGDDGTMIAVNLTLATTLGYSRADLQGWHVQKILPPGGRVFYNTHVFPLLKMHGAADEIYIPLRTRDGNDVPMLLNATRRTTTGGEFNDCVFVRMMQRHQFEGELVEARRAAEQASASKSRFLSMMSHDLRTPLTAVAGYAELLRHGVAEKELVEYATAIREAAHDVSKLVDDVLSFAQLESGRVAVRPAPLSIDEAIRRAAMLVKPKMQEAEISFETRDCDQVWVRADGDRLQQILLNLLSNAIKFTPPGGRVEVSCERHDGRVHVVVADSGVGIPEDQFEHVFEPFVQLDHPAEVRMQGVGLGLAISRELARVMEGDLTANRSADGGAAFTIELPAAAGVTATTSSR